MRYLSVPFYVSVFSGGEPPPVAYEITITAPIAGSRSAGSQTVTVTVTPSVSGGTAITVLDGVLQVGTGTVGSGAVTSPLDVGEHSLTARVVVDGQTFTSEPVALTLVPAYVEIETVGTTFGAQQVVWLAPESTADVTWTCVETGLVATGTTPNMALGAAAVRHVRMTVTANQFSDVHVLNLGFLSTDDAGLYGPGRTYMVGTDFNHTAEEISAVTGLENAIGLRSFMAANIPTLTGALDLPNNPNLLFIELFHSAVTGLTYAGSNNIQRLCIEGCNLNQPGFTLDLIGVAASLYDFRSGAQGGLWGNTTNPYLISTLPEGVTMARLYHWCLQGSQYEGGPRADQCPVMEEWWTYVCGQEGELHFVSPVLRSLQAGDTDRDPIGNRHTAITLGPTTVCGSIMVQQNKLSASGLSDLLIAAEAQGSSNNYFDARWCVAPDAASADAVAAMRARNWTVLIREDVGLGVDSDDFEAATTLASRGWVSGIREVATAEVIDYGAQHALSITHSEWSYRWWLNPGLVVTAGTNYAIEAQLTPEMFAAGIRNVGLIIKTMFGTGIQVMFQNNQTLILGAGIEFFPDPFAEQTVLHELPACWVSGSNIRRLRLSVYGDQVDVYCGDVVEGLTHVVTATSTINQDVTNTYYGFAGSGSSGGTPSHVFPSVFVEPVLVAPSVDLAFDDTFTTLSGWTFSAAETGSVSGGDLVFAGSGYGWGQTGAGGEIPADNYWLTVDFPAGSLGNYFGFFVNATVDGSEFTQAILTYSTDFWGLRAGQGVRDETAYGLNNLTVTVDNNGTAPNWNNALYNQQIAIGVVNGAETAMYTVYANGLQVAHFTGPLGVAGRYVGISGALNTRHFRRVRITIDRPAYDGAAT